MAPLRSVRQSGTAICLVLGLGLVASCKRQVPLQPQLTVAAAADLQGVLQEIAQAFDHETGIKVVLSFGSSGNLTQQIEHGAPFDVFAAANVGFVERLAKQGLIVADSEHVYAQGQITLWQRKDARVQVNSLADLTNPEIKHVAIANPEHAPYGIAAVEALKSAGVYDEVESKLVFGENIAETLQFAESGNADAAIVARALSDRPDGRWTMIDASLHKPLNQAVCVIKSTHNEMAARQFVDFLGKLRAVAALKRYGFTIPVPPKN